MTQGIHQAVLDWSTGVIVKLAAALPKLSTTATAATGTASKGLATSILAPAAAPASPNGDRGGDSTGERHARNARRWLSDPRIWRAFVRSLRGGATSATEPSTHLPQSASLGILRAAVFAVRAEAGEANGEADAVAGAECSISRGEHMNSVSSRNNRSKNVSAGGGDESGTTGSGADTTAGDWAFVAILTLCGGGIVAAGDVRGEGTRTRSHSSGSMTKINGDVLRELLPPRQIGAEKTGKAAGPGKWGRGGGVMRMSLDVYVTFLVEVIRGHVAVYQAPPPHMKLLLERGVGGRQNESMAAAIAAAGVEVTVPSPLAEGVLTELLRFLVVLQAQQPSRRKVRMCV